MTGTFTAELHPHAAAGSPNGGQFVANGGSGAAPAKAKKGPRRRGTHPAGSMYWDPKSNRGTGYGQRGGDARVRALQQALNRLHLTDSNGRPLAVDGKLGPKTTSAVKRLQRRLGVKADGVVTPALLSQIRTLKVAPAVRPRKRAIHPQVKRATQSYDPMQKRDEHGMWSKIGAVLKHIGDMRGSEVGLHEPFGHSDEHHTGLVAFHHDGSFSIHSHDGQSSPSHAVTVSGDEVEALHTALDVAGSFRPGRDKPGEDSGDGWHLSWDENGATLTGTDASGAQTKTELSRAEVDNLESALADARERARDYDGLVDVKPLAADETLDSKKKFGGNGDYLLGAAAVDGPDGRTVRIAPLGGADSPARALKAYSGGEGQSSAVLDKASADRLAEELGKLAADAEARRKGIAKAHDAADKPDGYDNALFDQMTAQWATAPDPKGRRGVDGLFGEPVEVQTPWGTLVVQGQSDEFGEWTVSLGIRPKGAVQGKDWSLDGTVDGSHDFVSLATKERGYALPIADLEPKDIKALQKYLRQAFGPVNATEADGNARDLHHYWTRGEGLAKWAASPQPWTSLYHHLVKFMDLEEAKRTAANWFHDVFHFWPGSDVNRVTHGKPPRGKKIGPG